MKAALVVQPLETRELSVAQGVQAIFALARLQEAAEIGAAPPISPQGPSVDEIMKSAEFFLGAHDQGELVGVLTVGPDAEAGQVALTTLVVSPKHQRRGIGAALVQQALDRGKGLVFSVTASANNLPALSLYKSLGFVAYRWGSLGEAQLPMVKLRRQAA